MNTNLAINLLIEKWRDRLSTTTNDSAYKIALSECIDELENTIWKT